MNTWTDEELVQQHLSGDKQAFNQLVERYAGRLYNLAYRILLNQEEAEDIVQDTFLRAFEALPHSHAERPFRPWVTTITLNACRSALRKKRPLLFAEVAPPDEDEDDFLESLPSEDELPAELMETEEMEAALEQALTVLTEEERVILTLRYNEDLSYEEIGEMLHIPTASVGTHLFRAKHRLLAALADEQEVDS